MTHHSKLIKVKKYCKDSTQNVVCDVVILTTKRVCVRAFIGNASYTDGYLEHFRLFGKR